MSAAQVEVGDIWKWVYSSSSCNHVHVLVMDVIPPEDEEGPGFSCLTLENGEIGKWNLHVVDESEYWEFVS